MVRALASNEALVPIRLEANAPRSYPVGGPRAPNFPTATLEVGTEVPLQVVLRSNRSLPTDIFFFFALPCFSFLSLCMSLQADSFGFGVL